MHPHLRGPVAAYRPSLATLDINASPLAQNATEVTHDRHLACASELIIAATLLVSRLSPCLSFVLTSQIA